MLGTQAQQLLNAQFRPPQQIEESRLPNNRPAQVRFESTRQLGVWPDHDGLQPFLQAAHGILLVLEGVPAGIVDQTKFATDRRQAAVGVILAQQQAVLGAAGEHPIRLDCAPGNQVVNHDTHVGICSSRRPGFPARNP